MATEFEKAKAAVIEAWKNLKAVEVKEKILSSFESKKTVYLLRRVSIDNGRFEGVEGIFSEHHTAVAFANLLPGYGLGKDLIITSHDLLTLNTTLT